MATRNKRPMPVAGCTQCGQVSHDPRYVGEECHNRIDGKKCKGTFHMIQSGKDCHECHPCDATGLVNGSRCVTCSGDGWIYIRRT